MKECDHIKAMLNRKAARNRTHRGLLNCGQFLTGGRLYTLKCSRKVSK